MAGGILKKERARQGEAVKVSARQAGLPEPPVDDPASAGAGKPADPPKPRPAVRPLYQEQVKREAHSAAEQIKQEAQEQAAQIVAQATEAAEALKAKAEAEVAQLTKTAEESIAQRQATLEQQVRNDLTKEYQERYLNALKALEGAASTVQKGHGEYLSAIEQPAFELVLAIARQVLGRELADPVRSLPELIAHAFQLLQPLQPLKVHVSPATFQQLTDSELFTQALARAGVRLERIELEIDSQLGDGQFRAESGGSYVECDLPALLEELTGHLSSQAGISLGLEAQER